MNWIRQIVDSIDPDWRKVLRPGFGLKRWLLLYFAGVTVAGLGFALLIREWYISNQLPSVIYIIALQWLPDWLRAMLLLLVGVALGGLGVLRFNRALMNELLPGQNVLKTLVQRQQRRQGPKIVAIGGGTGMPQLLRGLRLYTDNITAIVTVADDGGSSGRLRRQMRLLPPGDFRNNIAALSESEGLMMRLFQYRFAELDQHAASENGADERSALAGHSFGNLFIATMAAVTGSFEAGIAESSRVLAVRGRILPCTLQEVTLCAEVRRKRSGDKRAGQTDADGASQTASVDDNEEEWLTVEGESNLVNSGGQIMRVFLNPEQPRAYPEAIRAILQADLIVAGPGSFFTSVMPNLLVPAVHQAICAASAPRIYLCNLVTQHGETDHFTVSDHMRQLRNHVGEAFTTVLANDNYDINQQLASHSHWVTLPGPNEPIDYRLFTGALTDTQRPWRHDPVKLAARLMEVYEELVNENVTTNLTPDPSPEHTAAQKRGERL